MIIFNSFFPVTISPKLAALKSFYEHWFDFRSVFFQADFYLHLISDAGPQLGFLHPEHASQPDFLQAAYPGQGLIYSFEVKDATRLYGQLKEQSLDIILPLKDEPWGQRHFILRDPAGLPIDIIQPLAMTD